VPYPVESIGHINFKNHTLISSFPTRMNSLHQYNVIYNLSFFHKATLIWGDEFVEKRFDFVGYDFSYDLIRYITKGYGSKYGEGGRIQILLYERQKGGVCVTPNLSGFLNILEHPQEIIFYNIPNILVEMHTKTIWPWSFVWMKLEQSLMELLFYDFLFELIIVLLTDNTRDIL
jgi:hypothetical protein